MGTATLVLVLAGVTLGDVIPTEVVERQDSTFKELWETDFVWKFDDLPLDGGVESARIPYSGYIYPDTEGGTTYSLSKYDRAYNGGKMLASGHEKWDTTAFKEPVDNFFGKMFKLEATPDWYGHCNGWTAAAIRHAEPVHSVTKNGVTFAPSDIKALLAELYIYNQHEVLAGENEEPIGAAAFHAIIANWVGRGEHPLGIEAEPGEEKWNYPAYAYAASAAKHSARQVEVTMNVVYASDSREEWDESPRIEEVKYFHYMLDLDAEGKIVGGHFLHDSSEIDMLWAPLSPVQPGEHGNEMGNPYINAETILALWRESVPSETRMSWLNVDPTEIIDRDRLNAPIAEVVVVDESTVLPLELAVPTRVVKRTMATLTPTTSTTQQTTNVCYGGEQMDQMSDFNQLLRGNRSNTATHPATSPTLVR